MLFQLWLRLRALMAKTARRAFLACRLLLLGHYQILATLHAVSRQTSAAEQHADVLERKAKQQRLTNMLISKQLAKLKPDVAAIAASKSAAEAAANAATAAQAQRAASAQHRAQWLAIASRTMATHSRARDRSSGTNKRRRPPIPITNSNAPVRRRL